MHLGVLPVCKSCSVFKAQLCNICFLGPPNTRYYVLSFATASPPFYDGLLTITKTAFRMFSLSHVSINSRHCLHPVIAVLVNTTKTPRSSLQSSRKVCRLFKERFQHPIERCIQGIDFVIDSGLVVVGSHPVRHFDQAVACLFH